jgi:hypothetical protein
MRSRRNIARRDRLLKLRRIECLIAWRYWRSGVISAVAPLAQWCRCDFELAAMRAIKIAAFISVKTFYLCKDVVSRF